MLNTKTPNLGHGLSLGTFTPDPSGPDSTTIEIKISPLTHGFVCEIGLQTIAVERTDDLILVLRRYLENPSKTERDILALRNFKNTFLNVKIQ
jgi:hypothetical protein